MKTQLKRHLATARQVSSSDPGVFAPEFLSRPRPGLGLSRALAVRDWAEGQGFPVQISQGKTTPGAALPLSFHGHFQYG